MPGAIQVSVLDFTGLPSSSSPSSISIKISMGKTEYQTWDKGDFSFPLMTLRQNLVVTLLDAEGNEISHTDIDTMLVVEKGSWDDIFPLKGGGHVHMKLQFILSVEERNRIRVMRESALKKKHCELLNSSRCSETASLPYLFINKEVSDLQRGLPHTEPESIRDIATRADPIPNPLNFCVEPKSSAKKMKGVQLDGSTRTLADMDRSAGGSSTVEVAKEAGICYQTELDHRDLDINSISPKLVENQADDTGKWGSLRKSSSNVRKMISAFENSVTQDTRHHVDPPFTRSQSSKSWKEVLLRCSQKVKETETWNAKSTQRTLEEARDSLLMDEVQLTAAYIRKTGEQIGSHRAVDKSRVPQHTGQLKELSAKHIQSKSSMRNFPGEAAIASGGMFNHGGRFQSCNLVTDQRDAGGTSVTQKDGLGIQSRYSGVTSAGGGSKDKMKPVPYCNSKESESCGSWIFPDEGRRICLTTSNEKVMNLMGSFPNEVDIHQRKHEVHGNSHVEGKQGKKTSRQLRKRLESSADAEPSRGPFSRVIKVAIMVGFGTFVLFTRQRNNR